MRAAEKAGRQRSSRSSRPISLDHFPSTYQREREKKCFPRPRAIHFRANLSRGGVAIKRSVSPATSSSPSPRYLPRNFLLFPCPSSFLPTISILRPPSNSLSLVPPQLARYGAESAVPHSDEPIFRPVAIALYTTVRGYEERQRARKRLRGLAGSGMGW